ncbi:sensor histidine kinase [Aureimonas glaciei]|uniref:Sensor histidine kinase n=1 Tax=Aureimonas glaciei TaxID=1776957 RepID=A0A916YAG7_9HYPH|nr:sensor histidine kinase [Aureimonas glaciei]GGD36304.1 sensor histidine kinase [Aureimonas glaciei]
MSLRGRIAATIAIATLVMLIVGGAMSVFHAQRRIAAEMDAAGTVAGNALTRLIAELPASPRPQHDLEGLVRTFNGDRHVRILLVDAFGRVRLQSSLAMPSLRLPPALERFLAPPQRTRLVPLPSAAAPVVAAMLVVAPINEIAEVWSELTTNLVLLAVFVALSFGLVFAIVGRALAPLGELVSAFHRIGKGDYAVALAPRGPPELAALSRSCNDMAARLQEMDRRNRRLSEQLMRLQDEERAGLARDLHDDVGPFLFAIDVDAGGIVSRAGADGEDDRGEILERAEAIRRAAQHARQEVRRILGRLRPGLLSGIGLKGTLDHLVADCLGRHPGTAFRLDVTEADLGAETEALLFRVVREAVNNALRHGRPTAIGIRIQPQAGRVSFRVTDDGGGWPTTGTAGGYGLIGMRERVEAAGGVLTLGEIAIPPGISVSGFLPGDPLLAGLNDVAAQPASDALPALSEGADDPAPQRRRSGVLA